MKKVLSITMMALMATAIAHAEGENNAPGQFGLGYQGVIILDHANESPIMNEIMLRFAPQPIGGAILIGQQSYIWENDPKTWEETASVLTLQGKFYYRLIERKNSDFYIGGLLGFARYDAEWDPVVGPTDEENYNSFILGFLAGVEWRFNELPELGFNFELGYNLEWSNLEDWGGDEEDAMFAGTSVSMGATYYF